MSVCNKKAYNLNTGLPQKALWISMFALVAQRSRRANRWDSGLGRKRFPGEGREEEVGGGQVLGADCQGWRNRTGWKNMKNWRRQRSWKLKQFQRKVSEGEKNSLLWLNKCDSVVWVCAEAEGEVKMSWLVVWRGYEKQLLSKHKGANCHLWAAFWSQHATTHSFISGLFCRNIPPMLRPSQKTTTKHTQ